MLRPFPRWQGPRVVVCPPGGPSVFRLACAGSIRTRRNLAAKREMNTWASILPCGARFDRGPCELHRRRRRHVGCDKFGLDGIRDQRRRRLVADRKSNKRKQNGKMDDKQLAPR